MIKAGERVLSYIVEKELGEGGMGTVFLGRHTVLNQQVAIKSLSPLLSRDQALRERFASRKYEAVVPYVLYRKPAEAPSTAR